MSGADLAERAREVAPYGATGATTAVSVRPATSGALVVRNALKLPEGASAHTTEFGYCVHDFTAVPCQLHSDCLNCRELVCVKGELHKEASLRQQAQETSMLLEVAITAQAEGDFGADRWVAEHRRTVTRLTDLLTLLDDPAVPVGAVIQPAHTPNASRLQQAQAHLLADTPVGTKFITFVRTSGANDLKKTNQ